MAGLRGHLESWAPEPVVDADELRAGPVAALSAVLDLPGPVAGDGQPLPPLWHWLYFLDQPAQHELGADGHPRAGHFLPPIPDRRRMFAGGRLAVHAPLLIGRPARRTSGLHNVEVKQGRTGELAFVTVRSEITQHDRVCVVEEQDLVYRSGEDARRVFDLAADAPEPAEPDGGWWLAARPDSRLLFRISALTANAHRIHYDEPYCREVEGYPGLVVHGPLLALLMLDVVRRNTAPGRVRAFGYRLRHPVFAGEKLIVAGRPDDAAGRVDLRVATGRQDRHATAEVTLRQD